MLGSTEHHFSDDWLIAHADGELSRRDHARVRNHLLECWHCRSRLAELERQIAAIVKGIEADDFPGPERIAKAQIDFLTWSRRQRGTPSLGSVHVRATRTGPALWAAAAALLLACGLAWFRNWHEAPLVLDVHTAIEKVQRAEPSLAGGAAAQVFELTSIEIRPKRRESRKHLELISDPGHGRLAARLESASGVLLRGVWQSQPGKQYFYDSARDDHAVLATRASSVHRVVDVFTGEPELEEFEWRYIQWLQQQRWRLISLGQTMVRLASEDGAALQGTYITDLDGRRRIRLVASKTVGAVSVQIVLDVDAVTHRPVVQTIRYTGPNRTTELRLIPGPVQTVTAARFEPDPVLLPPLRPASPRPTKARLAGGREEPLDTVSPPDLRIAEVEVLFALHRAGACLGEPIEVIREGGSITVRGVVATSNRREQLTAALSGLAHSIELKTTQEAITESADSFADHTPAHSDAPRYPFAPSVLQYFGAHREPAYFALRLHEEALQQAGSLLAEALALRNIVDRFGDITSAKLPEKARLLLAQMARDHLHAVNLQANRLRLRLTPVFATAEPLTSELPAAEAPWEDLTNVAGLVYGSQLGKAFRPPSTASQDDIAHVLLVNLWRLEGAAEMAAAKMDLLLANLRQAPR